MPTKTKGEIVDRAFSWLKVSGLTSKPSPNEISKALDVLEGYCYELDSRNICTNFTYEDYPDPATESGIDNAFWLAAAYGLGVRLAPEVGKPVTQDQMKACAASTSNWAARTSVSRQVQAPRRQPRGSGNTFRNLSFNRYYKPQAEAPISCDTIQIMRGSIESYTFSIEDYLGDTQTLSSYTIDVTDGLTILSESMASPVWSYQVECKASAVDYQAIQLTVTTDLGNKKVFTINFNVFGALLTT